MAEDWQQKLGLLLANLGGGISSAGSANRPIWEGIGPGAMGFANALGQQQRLASQQAQQKELMDLQRRQFGLREQEFTDKRDERKRLQDARMGWTPPGATPGMGVPQAAPTIGPGSDYFTRVGGDESGGKYDIRNAKGSGAYGKYQFMPDTWADVATKNPQLGLPFNIAQSTPEQQEAAMRALTASNAQSLQQRGIQPAPENLYLAHRFGVEGASKVVSADPNTPIASLFPPIWSQQNPDMQGVTVGQFRQNVGGRYGGAPMPQVAQGDNIPRADGSGTPLPPQNTIAPPMLEDVPRPALPPADAQRLQRAVQGGLMTIPQAETEARQIIDGLWTHQREMAKARFTQGSKDQWRTLEPREVAMYPGLDPNKTYQRNQRGEIKPIGGGGVTVNTGQQQTEFGKAMGKMDAERFGEIIKAEGTMNDMASKLGFALDQFRQTYTGPGAETALSFFKTLGAFGNEDMAKKANAAEAAQAVINQMKPHMRASGSGASSDKDMDMFAKALPSLLNLPGGNERITTYFQRMADRATQIRQLAQEHSQGGTVPLTGTGFDDAVKALGPLFSKEELAEMQAAGKAKPADNRKPLGEILGGAPPNMTPIPNRPPLGSILGGQ